MTKAYETLSDPVKRAVYDDDQISDDDFFSLNVAGFKVNLLNLFMGTAVCAMAGLAAKKYTEGQKEGACPVDHKARAEMVDVERKR